MKPDTTSLRKPPFELLRKPVFGFHQTDCHVTLKFNAPAFNPVLLRGRSPEEAVGEWRDAIENFFTANHVGEQVRVLPQQVAEEGGSSWCISCVNVPPPLMAKFGHFLDSDLMSLVRGKTPRDLAGTPATGFAAQFEEAHHTPTRFIHGSTVSMGGTQRADVLNRQPNKILSI